MEAYSVEYYETEDGKRPAEDFILSQDKKMRAKIFMALELLELKGPELREPYHPDKRLCKKDAENAAGRDQQSQRLSRGSQAQEGELTYGKKFS